MAPNTDVYFAHDWVEREYRRWMPLIGVDDPYVSDRTLGVQEVLRAHFLIVDFFADGGDPVGGVGPKSIELLHSAVYRQFVAYGGRQKWERPLDKCATLLFGLVKDHAFHDANKRTAMLSALLFLQKKCISRTPTASDVEIENFLVDIAKDELEKFARFRDMKKKGVDDVEVRFISDWLHRNTREVDRRSYSVTYHQLATILRRFGFGLENPNGNYIDVVRYERHRAFLGFGSEKVKARRIAHVGFPGWKSQVSKGDLKRIRDATKLTEERGCDSQVFFRGVDPVYSLINRYAEPLRRLAHR